MLHLCEGFCGQVQSQGPRPDAFEHKAPLLPEVRKVVCPEVVPLQARRELLPEERESGTRCADEAREGEWQRILLRDVVVVEGEAGVQEGEEDALVCEYGERSGLWRAHGLLYRFLKSLF